MTDSWFVIAFDLKRQRPFVHLSFEGLSLDRNKILGQLLRKRGSSFNLVAGQIFPGCSNDADGIDTNVVVEARILNGEDSVLPFWVEFTSYLRGYVSRAPQLAHHSFVVSA